MSESPVDYNTHRERCLFYSWCAARLASKDARTHTKLSQLTAYARVHMNYVTC